MVTDFTEFINGTVKNMCDSTGWLTLEDKSNLYYQHIAGKLEIGIAGYRPDVRDLAEKERGLIDTCDSGLDIVDSDYAYERFAYAAARSAAETGVRECRDDVKRGLAADLGEEMIVSPAEVFLEADKSLGSLRGRSAFSTKPVFFISNVA